MFLKLCEMLDDPIERKPPHKQIAFYMDLILVSLVHACYRANDRCTSIQHGQHVTSGWRYSEVDVTPQPFLKLTRTVSGW